MKRAQSDDLGLFDEVGADEAPIDGIGPEGGLTDRRVIPVMAASAGSDLDEWREVPQPLFLSWSAARQAAYCARRDENSALTADSPEEARWFLARSKLYKEMIHVL